MGIRHIVVVVERLNLVKKEFADFVNFECHVPSALKIPTVLQICGGFFALFLFFHREGEAAPSGRLCCYYNECLCCFKIPFNPLHPFESQCISSFFPKCILPAPEHLLKQSSFSALYNPKLLQELGHF